MKKWMAIFGMLVFGGLLASEALAASVGGYYRSDGTYVQPHFRTNPDGNPYNNYGFPGNFNPNTGMLRQETQIPISTGIMAHKVALAGMVRSRTPF